MARYNEILAGRFNRSLQKLFSMKGEPPAPQCASDIQPTIPMFYGLEMRNPEGWQRYSARAQFAALAASVSFARIRVSPNSKLCVVVEQISLNFVATDEWVVQLDLANSAALASVPGQWVRTGLDNRGGQNPSAELSTTQGAASATPNYDDISGAVNTSYALIKHPEDEILILPDMQLTLQSSTVNSIARLSMRWRERVLEESEAVGIPKPGV